MPYEHVEWVHLTQPRLGLLAVVNNVMNIQVP